MTLRTNYLQMKKEIYLVFLILTLTIGNGIGQITSLIRGPYLQLSTENSVYIRWRTDSVWDTKVNYGSSPDNLPAIVYNDSAVKEHIIQLTGLLNNTKYYYSIGSGTTPLQGDSSNYFWTHPPVGSTSPVRIWAIGDAGTNLPEQNRVRDAYYNYTGDTYTNVWLMLGDNAYPYGEDSDYQVNVFNNHYESMLKKTTAWTTAGNHEMYSSDAFAQTGPYFEIFTLPKNGEAGGISSLTEAYYSFNYANIHFACLESTTDSFRAAESNMLNWLKSDLAANTQHWTIVYFHHPPYSKGSHDSDTDMKLIEMRQNIVPVLESYGVDLVLTGHDHTYTRSHLIKGHFGLENTYDTTMLVNTGSEILSGKYFKSPPSYLGTVYVVCGVSGDAHHRTSPLWPHNAMHYSTNIQHGSMVIDVVNDTLNGKFLNDSNIISDQFTIVKHSFTSTSEFSEKYSHLKIFPNPAKSTITMQFTLSIKTDLVLRITNGMGQLIYMRELKKIAGEYNETIELSNYSRGIYFVEMITEKEHIYIKAVLN